MNALIRKVTPTSDFLIINNFNKAKNDITAHKSFKEVRVYVHQLVEIMHALIRKFTSDNT